jgi:hypothetical protein
MDFVMTSHEALDKSDIMQVGSNCQVLCTDFFCLPFISQVIPILSSGSC